MPFSTENIRHDIENKVNEKLAFLSKESGVNISNPMGGPAKGGKQKSIKSSPVMVPPMNDLSSRINTAQISGISDPLDVLSNDSALNNGVLAPPTLPSI